MKMPSSSLLAKLLLALLGAALLVQGQLPFNGIYTVRSGSRGKCVQGSVRGACDDTPHLPLSFRLIHRYLSYTTSGKTKMQSSGAKNPKRWIIKSKRGDEARELNLVTFAPDSSSSRLQSKKLKYSKSCSSKTVSLGNSGMRTWRLKPYRVNGRRMYGIDAVDKSDECRRFVGAKGGSKTPKLKKSGSRGTKWTLTLIRSLDTSPPVPVPSPPVPSPPVPSPPAPDASPLFYTINNGRTVVCPDAPLNSQGFVPAEGPFKAYTYTRRNRAGLLALVGTPNESLLSTSCTSGVTDMSNLFENATSGVGTDWFKVTVGRWDTSSVTTMAGMFRGTAGNKVVGWWNTSNVEDMSGMFQDAGYTGQPNSPIGLWDTSKVKDFSSMFEGCTINEYIGSWNTGAATNMSRMFANAPYFNKPGLSEWDMSSVTDTSYMFYNATSFAQPLLSWNVASVTDMTSMFERAVQFDFPLYLWKTGNVKSFSGCFASSNFDQDLTGWNTSSAIAMDRMFFNATRFNGMTLSFRTDKVLNFTSMFEGASSFNQYVGGDPTVGTWIVQSARSMNRMFYSATSFNQNLQLWNAGSLSDCQLFAVNATAWQAAYAGSIAGKTPPLSASMISAGCGAT